MILSLGTPHAAKKKEIIMATIYLGMNMIYDRPTNLYGVMSKSR